MVLEALSPVEVGSEDLCLCPVRALKIYVDRTAQWHESDQLFVCFGSKNKGCAVTNQCMSHWLVEAISLAYEARGIASPLRIQAHSTRVVASSQAFLNGASMDDICAAAGWSSPSTFVKFYSLDVRMAPGSWVLSAWADAFFRSQLSQVRQAWWYSIPIRWRHRSIEVTYEKEHLGYVCNHGSLHRERDAAVQAIPTFDSVSLVHEIWVKWHAARRYTMVYYAYACVRRCQALFGQ